MSDDAPLVDAEARARIAGDLGATFLVEAAAGTGKTTALVERLVACVAAGDALRRMVVVTFTHKAAGELKLRVREALEGARLAAEDDLVRARFTAALAELEVASIGTIHGFCADLLRAHPVEAAVDPAFETLDGESRDRELRAVLDRWLSEVLDDPPEGVARVLRRPTGYGDTPSDRIFGVVHRLAEHRDHDAPWSRPEGFDRAAAMEAIVAGMRSLGARATEEPREDDWLRKALVMMRDAAAEIDARAAAREGTPRDAATRARLARDAEDRLEQELTGLLTHFQKKKMWSWKGSQRSFAGARDAILAERDALHGKLVAFRQAAEADLAAALQRDLRPVLEAYAERKQRTGSVDFLDLLLRTRDLLRERDGVRETLRAEVQRVFVDEFQDTDPLQAEILVLLAAEAGGSDGWREARLAPGKLFVVGDPKQAIYRFRRADLAVYEDVKARVLAAGGEVLALRASFRARPAIQRVLNAAFAEAFGDGEAGVQAAHVPLAPVRGEGTGPAVVALAYPDPYWPDAKMPYRGVPHLASGKVDDEYPRTVAAFLRQLIDSGLEVEVAGQCRPLQARDVTLLFRNLVSRWKDVAGAFVRALEAHGLPHVLHGGRAFHDREEVVALRTALGAVEHPDDALAVYATLRGPLFGLTDGSLLAFRARHGALHPFLPEKASDGEDAIIFRALALIREAHVGRNRRPVAETLGALLANTRTHAAFGWWWAGDQVLANVERFVGEARRFDASAPTSFRAFLRRFDEAKASDRVRDVPLLEEDADGVRLMTVHAAKGLEAPVVVLANPMSKRSRERPSRYVDGPARLWAMPLAGCQPAELTAHAEAVCREDAAEEDRVLYVAATRARDVLVVPAHADFPQTEVWVAPLAKALRPAARSEPAAVPAVELATGRELVLRRAPGLSGQLHGVRGGRHRVPAGEVDWWDLAGLPTPLRPGGGGFRDWDPLVPGGGPAETEARQAFESWSARTAARRARAGRATVRAEPAREAAARRPGGGGRIAVQTTGVLRPS
ncbi:MAG: UvrD-helicase domain-containing protein, partial [Myxococcota bacterium]